MILGRKNAWMARDSFVPHPASQETLRAIMWRPDLQPDFELDEPSGKLDKEPILNVQEATPIQFRPKALGCFWDSSFFPLASRCCKMELLGRQDSELDCGKAVGLHLQDILIADCTLSGEIIFNKNQISAPQSNSRPGREDKVKWLLNSYVICTAHWY